MRAVFNSGAPKRPTNLSINSDLLSQARALNLNLSSLLETALEEQVRKLQAQKWLEMNRQAIADYNAHIEADGVFGEGLRSF